MNIVLIGNAKLCCFSYNYTYDQVHVPVCPICNHIIKKSKNEDINSQVSLLKKITQSVIESKRKKTKNINYSGCHQSDDFMLRVQIELHIQHRCLHDLRSSQI